MTGMPPKTFTPLVQESVRFDSTAHRMIEGDNLDVMHALLPTYGGQFKLVYIDPPYNTGNNFTYGDRRGEEWVQMMHPRLKIAHEFVATYRCVARLR